MDGLKNHFTPKVGTVGYIDSFDDTLNSIFLFQEPVKNIRNVLFRTKQRYDILGGEYQKSELIDVINNLYILDKKSLSSKEEGSKVKQNECIERPISVEKPSNPRIIVPTDYETIQELFDAVETWWEKRWRRNPSTWRRYERLLVDMANDPLYPVDVFNPEPDQVVAYLDNKEDMYAQLRDDEDPNYGAHAIINRWKALSALMRSYGRLDELKNGWNYVPPTEPDSKPKPIPSPQLVYKFMHHDYSKDHYEKRLYQYLFTFGFFIGPRPSSELSIMKTTDIDFETGILSFYQPKVNCWRTEVPLEEELISFSNRKSLRNWVDKWRPKVENQYSGNYLFLQPNGRPFTEAYLAKKLREMGTQVWGPSVDESNLTKKKQISGVTRGFYPYCMRHWCATARLISWKARTGTFATKEVCDFMQHSSEKVTETYTKRAKTWYQKAPYDWISTLLKFHTKTLESMEQYKGVIE